MATDGGGRNKKRASVKPVTKRRGKAAPELSPAELERVAVTLAPHIGRYIDAAPGVLWGYWWNKLDESAEKKRLERFLFPDGYWRKDMGTRKTKKALKQICRESPSLMAVIIEEFLAQMKVILDAGDGPSR